MTVSDVYSLLCRVVEPSFRVFVRYVLWPLATVAGRHVNEDLARTREQKYQGEPDRDGDAATIESTLATPPIVHTRGCSQVCRHAATRESAAVTTSTIQPVAE